MKKRKFFKRELFEIEFDNGDIVYMQIKPKKYSNCINGFHMRPLGWLSLKEKYFNNLQTMV